jgi:hypothetical protein
MILDIDKLEAGRELDALVAEKLMGWPLRPYNDPDDVRPCFNLLDGQRGLLVWEQKGKSGWWFSPSTNIAAAWEVLGRLTWQWEMGYDPGGWGEVKVFVWDESEGEFATVGATFNHPGEAPLAICLAALKAVEAKGRC